MENKHFKPMDKWTFEEDDQLDLGDFAKRLLDYLIVDHHFASGSLVVSLDAPFGSGKTSFLSMWKNRLLSERNTERQKPLPVLINAWENDFCGEPLLSLVLPLIEAAKNERSAISPEKVNKLTEKVKTVAWYTLGLGNNLVQKYTGLDPISAGKFAVEKTAGKGTTEIPDVVKLFEYQQDAFKSLKACLSDAFGGDEARAIVIVDELDRCRPDYAIDFLETIKHIFDLPGIIFVLAIDREQLATSAKALFGSDLKTSEYLRKFIARSFELPPVTETGIRKFVNRQFDRFLALPDVRKTSINFGELHKHPVQLCRDLKLTLRQTEEYFRIMGHVFSTQQEGRPIRSSWILGVMLLCVLKVKADGVYQAIRQQDFPARDFVEYLFKHMRENDVEFWGLLYYTGRLREGVDVEGFDQIWLSLTKKQIRQPTQISQLMSWFSREWGGDERDYVRQIYDLIETASTL